MIEYSKAEWQRVGFKVKQRRAELGLDQKQLVEGTGISVSVLQDIENGNRERYRELTIGRLERLLGWQPGSILAIAQGRDASPAQSLQDAADELAGALNVSGASYVARSPEEGVDLSSVSLDDLLEEVARRARGENPEADDV